MLTFLFCKKSIQHNRANIQSFRYASKLSSLILLSFLFVMSCNSSNEQNSKTKTETNTETIKQVNNEIKTETSESSKTETTKVSKDEPIVSRDISKVESPNTDAIKSRDKKDAKRQVRKTDANIIMVDELLKLLTLEEDAALKLLNNAGKGWTATNKGSWIHEKSGQSVRKYSPRKILYLDFGKNQLDNFNYLILNGYLEKEDKAFGSHYFEYKGYKIQYRKLDHDGRSGSTYNIDRI